MRKFNLLIITILLPCFVIAQEWGDINISRSRGSTTASDSHGWSMTIYDRDIFGGVSNNSSSRGGNSGGDRRSSNSSYSSNSNSQRSNSFSNYDRYDYEKEKRDREAREKWEKECKRREKEKDIILEANKMLSNNCIDIQRMQLAIDEFDNLSPISADGHNARAKLMAQKHNMEPIYNKYSLMAMNIRECAFGGINTRIMSLSYEDLDKYLKQFLNKHDFEQAKVEYQKYEKAKLLERDIEALHAHSNDKKYLRENITDVQKLKLVIKQQDALKYVDSYYSFLLDEFEKAIEYDEIKQIPLTVSNIKDVLGPKKATKNNADWKKISKGMTNQRLLSVLGTLNSDNNNILPDFVREEGGYYLFVGEPTETDTKIVTKEYLVSKDGSEIEIYETEGVVANDIVEIKETLGDNKASAKLTSDGEVEKKAGSTVAKNMAGAKVTLLNTDWHKQNKKNVYSIDTDGTILQYG